MIEPGKNLMKWHQTGFLISFSLICERHNGALLWPEEGSTCANRGEFGRGVIERFVPLGRWSRSRLCLHSFSSGIRLPSGFVYEPKDTEKIGRRRGSSKLSSRNCSALGEGRVAIYDNTKHGANWYYWLFPGERFNLRLRIKQQRLSA